MSGRVGDLSSQQECMLNELKINMSDVLLPHHTDQFLLRFLRARNFNLKLSEDMLRNHLHFRKEFDVDNILTNYTFPEAAQKYRAGGLIGYDKEGYPVRAVMIGSIDVIGALKTLTVDQIMKCYVFDFEENIKHMEEQTKKLGKVIDKHSYILDVDEISVLKFMKRPVLEAIYKCIKYYEQNFPELLRKVYIVNIRPAYYVVYNIIKNFIPAEILEKIVIVSQEETKEALLKDIDAEVLPAFLGGDKVDPDGNPRCPSMLNQGGTIPEEYYMDNIKLKFLNSSGITSITVSSGAAVPIEIPVQKTGTVINWEFQAIEKDVGFGFFFKEQGNTDDVSTIMEIKRFDCEYGPESGEYLCDKPGTYILKFDNSYSWIREVTVGYRIEVHDPMVFQARKRRASSIISYFQNSSFFGLSGNTSDTADL